jgi:hypothetical protein
MAGGVGEPMMFEADVPREIKDSHVYFWWALMFLWCLMAVGRCVALDLLGALVAVLMAYFVHFMVANNCEKMSQYCLFLFGFMCCMNTVLESINLASALNGRVQESAFATDQGTTSNNVYKTTYTITVEKHPFFSPKMGLVYNAQSVMMIASVFCNLLSGLLSRYSYNTYTTFLFADQDETFPMAQAPMGYGGASGQQQPQVQRFSGGGQRLGSNGPPRVFEGAGQRLGS